MINTILAPYPEEIFYSWIARICKVNSCGIKDQIVNELFGVKGIKASILYPAYLDSFIGNEVIQSVYTKESLIELIKEHSLISYLTFFMNQEDIITFYKGINEGSKRKVDNLLGINRRPVSEPNEIKFCLQCVDEDKLKYGEAYIHRLHQIPGNCVCLKHMRSLSKVPVHGKCDKNRFLCLSDILNESPIEYENMSLTQEMINLAEDMQYIMDDNISKLDFEVIWHKYNNMLKIKNYKSPNKLVFRTKLIESFNKFYPKEFLDMLNSSVEACDKHNWISEITNNDITVDATRHLLFIRFLFGSVKEFIAFEGEYKPFGSGPWPCMNPVSGHYKQDIITECMVYKNKHTGKSNGKFKCSECGFTYTRNESEDYIKDRYKISQYVEVGEVWNKKLKELLLQLSSIPDIAAKMNCSEDTVVRHAVKLGFKDKINRKVDIKTNKGNSQNSILEKHKNRLIAFVNTYPGKSRTEIYRAEEIAYRYILKYDKKWLDNNINNKIKSSHGSYNYEKKDKELSIKIKMAVDYLLELEPPVRITLSSISRKIDYYMLGKKEFMNKLSISKRILEENLESQEQYKIRKNKYIIHQLQKSNMEISYRNITRHTSLTKSEYLNLKTYINSLNTEI